LFMPAIRKKFWRAPRHRPVTCRSGGRGLSRRSRPEPPRLTLADIARVLREWGAREEQAEGGGEPEHRAAAAWRPAAQAPATQAAGEASGRG
jgi:hypothetical protein